MNIGLIGFGSMGRTHAYAVTSLPFYYKDLPFSARIHGVCTKKPENALKAAAYRSDASGRTERVNDCE